VLRNRKTSGSKRGEKGGGLSTCWLFLVIQYFRGGGNRAGGRQHTRSLGGGEGGGEGKREERRNKTQSGSLNTENRWGGVGGGRAQKYKL
jgi:hypothetical protein